MPDAAQPITSNTTEGKVYLIYLYIISLGLTLRSDKNELFCQIKTKRVYRNTNQT